MNDEWPEQFPSYKTIPSYVVVTHNYAKDSLALQRFIEMHGADMRTPHRPGLRERITGWRRFRTRDGTVIVTRSGWRQRLYRLVHPGWRPMELVRIRLSKAIHPWHDDD